MKTTLNWMHQWLQAEPGLKDLSEALTMVGLEVEGVEPGDDPVLELGITPNRSDALSALGLSRDYLALKGGELKREVPELAMDALGGDKITLEEPEGCPHYLGMVIESVKVAPSPQWLQDRLNAIGVRPINNIVDILNYVMFDVGQPMHAFDLDKLDGEVIRVRQGVKGEKLLALNGLTYEVEGHLIIADKSSPVALAGIMGGEESGVTDGTTRILLESAWFEPRGVRRSRNQLGLSTDSSYRFERMVDPQGPARGMARALELIRELAEPGEMSLYSAGEPVPAPKALPFRPDRCNAFLNLELSAKDMGGILTRLGFQVHVDGDGIQVTAPSWRVDIFEETDLYEEILRIHGINAPPSCEPGLVDPESGLNTWQKNRNRLQDLLMGQGFSEVVSYSFTDPGLDADFGEGSKQLPLANPLAEHTSVMRTSLLPGVIQALARSEAHLGQDQAIRLFELGRVFQANASGELPTEEEHLVFLVAGKQPYRSPALSRDPQDMVDLLGALDTLSQAFRLPLSRHTGQACHFLHEGRWAALKSGETMVGEVGTIKTEVLEKHGIQSAVQVGILFLKPFFDALPERPVAFSSLSRFPRVHRDFSLEVPLDCGYGRLETLIRACDLPEDTRLMVDLKDQYRGKGVSDGHQVLTLGLVLENSSRTFRDQEVDEYCQQVVQALEKDLGVRLRGAK